MIAFCQSVLLKMMMTMTKEYLCLDTL